MIKILSAIVWVVLVIMTLNDLDGMKNIFMYYSWFNITMLSVSGIMILFGVTLATSDRIKVMKAFQNWTIDVFSGHIITMSITVYLLHTLQLDTTLICYLISVAIVYVAVGLGKLKSL
jgi:hypothetical protein